MSSTWKLNENSQGELKVKVDGEKWKGAQELAFKKLAKDVEADGFRKGSVPEKIARQKVSQQSILMEAIDEVATDALQEGIDKHDLWIIARPELGVEAIDENEVTLTFNVIIKPEVELGEYKGIKVEKESAEVTDEDIDNDLKALQSRYAELVVKEDGVVEDGDTAVIDFEGFKDDVAFEGGKGENYPLEIGSGSFIPGFEEQLIGMKNEESKDIKVTFPENYQAEELAGAPVVFKVTVHEIKRKELPEIDDDLIKDAEIKDVETLDAYKEYTRKNMEEQKASDVERKYENDLLNKLVEGSKVEIPEVMIDDEVNSMMNDFAQRLQAQGMQMEQYLQMTGAKMEDFKEQFKPEAKAKCEVRLVLDKIAEVENVEIDDKDCEVEYEKIANQYKMEVDKVKELISANSLKYDLRLQKAVEIVKDNIAE